jgi:recombination protein RecR
MRIPRAIQNVIESFERLPGIGPKSAQRLTFYLLHVPQHELDRFAVSIQNLKNSTKICSVCFSVDETDPCSICSDPRRDSTIICVVEQPLDVLALEKNGQYQGVYHVLHGRIDPLNNIGPEEIYVAQLISRVKREGERVKASSAKSFGEPREVILATNPTMEGEATAMYISKQIKNQNAKIKITRIGRGLPIGADIEYADGSTLQRAMEGRSEY